MTCCGAQLVVPIGGTIGVGTGRTDGGTMPQTVGGQMGGTSIALLHSGTICPLTHRQTQEASAASHSDSAIANADIIAFIV
jgi:hypothetical protein